MFFIFPGFGASCANKPNPQIDSRTDNLHRTSSRYHYGRCFTVRMHIHTIILHPQFDLVIANVLHVRLLVSRLHHSNNNLCGNNDFAMLLPSLRRRLPLVVEIVPNFRFYRRLSLLVLLSLFRYEIANRRCRLGFLVLRLHAHHGVFV